MKALMAAVIAAVMAVPVGAEAAKDTVIIGMRLEPVGLDPTIRAEAAISEATVYNIYETLTQVDNSGAVHPMLAKSWEVSDDGLTYTFHLLEGVTFHDGTTFDSADVKFTFERNAAEDSQNKRREVFERMERIETPDPYTVVITLKSPSSLLPFHLAQSTAVIVAPESYQTNATNPVGTGPYKFVEWTKGYSVEVTKYAEHRNADDVQIPNATFRFINDDTAQVTALLAGDIDYLPIISTPELFPQFENNPQFTTLQGTTEGETILAMNNKAPALSDIRVRRAIMHAIDRKALIEGAMAGYATPIGSHFAPHHPAYVDLTGIYPYDPAKAKTLLEEAGFGDGLELSLQLPPPSYARRGGEIIADMLGRVGIKATIENVEWAVWLEKVYKNRQYDLTVISHVEPMDMVIYTRPDYYFQYDSAEFRDIMKKADEALTVQDQTKYLQMAQRKLAEDCVNGFLFQLAKLGVAQKGLHGMWSNWPAFINKVSDLYWEE